MKSFTGPRAALTLLLAINLFNYIDRYILAAVLPTLKHEFLAGDPNQNGKAGLWTTAFLVTYMCAAPLFGWLADRFSRWLLIGISVAVWSLASGWSGLAMSFGMLLFTRVFVGIGEAGYGPAAPTIIADMYPIQKRGKVLAWFYAAIPVGSALGYMFGGSIADHLGWRWAFYLVVPPGLLLGALCFMMRDPRTMAKERAARRRPTMADYRRLLRIPSYLINTAAMTVMTFAIGGFSAWLPDYIFHDRRDELSPGSDSLGNIDFTFGAITASAGLIATVLGGWTGDKLREKFPSSYFLISGIGMLLAFPATLGVIYLPFPGAWVMIFLAVFFLFFNTGPSNTALANVSPPMVRATAYALNILIIHLLGDAISPPLIGVVRDRWNMDVALAGVSVMMLAAGALWFWGTRFLGRDTAAIEIAEARAGVSGA